MSVTLELIIQKAKTAFNKVIDDFGTDPFRLRGHVPEMEKWAKRMIQHYPDANADVVLLSVWLHDIGHYPLPSELDHAVRSEQRAKQFLEQEHCPPEIIQQVLHCVRAHRVKDVMPETLEAKIVAFCDSASHMTDIMMYPDIARGDKEKNIPFRVYAKMERDWRDLGAFPEVQVELKELYESWKVLLKIYEKINLS